MTDALVPTQLDLRSGKMNLVPHLTISTAVGAGVWAVTGDAIALPAAVAAGVLPDLDHLLDYYFRFIRRDWRYLFLLLHAWEYVAAGLVACVIFREPWLFGALLGYITQIGGDQLFNRPRWHTYLLTSRIARGFKFKSVLGRQDYTGYRAVIAAVPFGKEQLRHWFESRLPTR